MQAGEDMAGENNPVALAQAYAQLADLEMEFDQAEAELRMFCVRFSLYHSSPTQVLATISLCSFYLIFNVCCVRAVYLGVIAANTCIKLSNIVKHQIILYEPIYRRRNEVLATIPSFWTNIFVNFGPELDEHITPEDWAFLSENLISVNVSRPDANNNPRSFDIIFGLKENNGVVVTTEVRKSFVYKSLKDGNERWTGLISEPVEIKWVNEDKDLTGGINRLAIKIFELRKKRVEGKIEEKQKKKEDGLNAKGKSASKIKEDDGLSELELELEEKLNQHQSFFNWFSWTGEYFMVLEQEAKAKVKEETTTNGKGLDDEDEDDDDDDDDDDDGDDENEAIDVFPDGIKLAYLIADDMFPNALKHFGMC